MIKDVIVNLEHRIARDPGRDFAISIGETFDAHVAGIAFAYVPYFPAYVASQIPSDILAGMMVETENAALAAIDRFNAAARVSLVPSEHRLLTARGFDAPGIFAELARRFDLSVLMQTDPTRSDNETLIEASLFESGRPLIVVPYIQKEQLKLDHIVCCWDGSRAAARAINDALPLLRKAATVDLLIVLNEKTDSEPNRIRGAEIGKHLARQDVRVQVEVRPAPDIDVANAILSYAADNAATLIVMGGYGHPKLREVIMGGVTRDMLKSMTVPVFMSH